MKKILLFTICLGITTVLASSIFAAPGINKQISYQGTLKTSAGIKVADGDYDIVFRIYDAATDGNILWTGNHTASNTNPVAVTDGVFSVLLGSGSGNTMTLDFNDDTYWLGVKIGTDSEMTPRKRIGASGYAFNADTLDGIDSLSFLRSDAPDTIASTSASTILTITQSGTGDILNLFDEATEVFTVINGGNVGIGTTTPSEHLEVSGTGNQYIKVGSTDGSSPGIKMMRSDADDWRLQVTSNGRLYFANSNNDGANWYSYLYFGGTSQSAPVFRTNLASADLEIGAGDDLIFTTYSGAWNEQMRITAGGNVGIGITTPAYQLDVWDTAVRGYGAYINRASHSSLKGEYKDVFVLDKISQLNLKEWQYNEVTASTTGDYSRHLYPFADDFYNIFGLGDSEWQIGASDIAGVALKGVQELYSQVQVLGGELQGSLEGNLEFGGNIIVKGHTVFGRDTVGQAKILTGDTSSHITFEEEYLFVPIIGITPNSQIRGDYWVMDKETTGFAVQLSEAQEQDVVFDWHAFGSDEGKIYVSDGTVEDIEIVVVDNKIEEPLTELFQAGPELIPEPEPETSVQEEPVEPPTEEPELELTPELELELPSQEEPLVEPEPAEESEEEIIEEVPEEIVRQPEEDITEEVVEEEEVLPGEESLIEETLIDEPEEIISGESVGETAEEPTQEISEGFVGE